MTRTSTTVIMIAAYHSLAVMIVIGLASAFHTAAAQSATEQDPNTDFSKFRHDNHNHARLPCLLCHRRENNATRPAMPGGSNHLPCAGCHAKQFADNSSPICTICHPNARAGKLKTFPRLPTFNMKFDHARHLNMGSVSCSTCHKPVRNGMAMSIPAGF